MRINFIGELDFNDENAKVPGFGDGVTKSGNDFAKANPIVVAAKNNRGFCEFFGVKNDLIKTIDTDGNPIEIEYKDREDKDVLDRVSFNRKNVVVNGDDRHEFICGYDFAKYLHEHVDELKGKRVSVTGQVKKDEYNGNVKDKFEAQSIYVLKEDDERKNGLQLTAEIFFTKDDVDTADFKKEKKITINGYTSEYAGKDDNNKAKYEYYPITVTLDCGKVDFENEKHVKIMNFRLMQMGLKYEDGKLVNKLKAKTVYSNMFLLNYINGNEEIEFTEAQLTEVQKQKIELGLATLDDFKPKGKIFGDSIKIYKVKDFTLTGNYSEGLKVSDESVADFEERIHVVAPKEVSAEEVMEKKEDIGMNEPVDDEDDDDGLEDLFG